MKHNLYKKSVLLAACSVFIATLLLGYSAYGWFTVAKRVTATVKDVTITAPDNLEISAESATSGFSSIATVNMKKLIVDITKDDEKKFNAQSDKFSLMPASSYNGLEMWKTDYAECEASNFDSVNLGNSGNGRIRYRESTGSFEGYFLDIPLWLRTASSDDLNIHLSADSAIIPLEKTNVEKTVRCCFLNSDKDNISFNSSNNIVNKTEYKALVFAGEGNSCSAIVKDTDGDSISNLTSPCKYLTTSNNDLTNVKICTVPKYSEEYNTVKINLRIWIEGQDNSCVASIGNGEFKINLVFEI